MRDIAICRKCQQYSEFTKEERFGNQLFKVLNCLCNRDRRHLPERMFREQRLPFWCDMAMEQTVICHAKEPQ